MAAAKKYRHASTSAWRRVEDDGIVLDLETSAYYSLNEVGSFIWERLGEGKTLDEVVAEVCDAYEVAEPEARKDAEELVAKLVSQKLLEPA